MMKMEDSYLGMLHDDPYSEYNYYDSQVYVPAASPGPSTVQCLQFVHPYAEVYANRPNTHPYTNHLSQPSTSIAIEFNSVSLPLVANQYFTVSKCAHARQKLNLAERNLVEIFGRAKQLLSVQYVRTSIFYERVVKVTRRERGFPVN